MMFQGRTGRDEAADVRHVSQQVCLGGVRDLAHARVVDRARVCAGARNQHLHPDGNQRLNMESPRCHRPGSYTSE